MSQQVKIRARISEELVEIIDNYFIETESINWFIMRMEIKDCHEICGIFPNREIAAQSVKILRKKFPNLLGKFEEVIIWESDWKFAYKKFLKVWNNRKLYWIPLWERDLRQIPKDSAIVYLDAGMAFGTGAHETTRLCADRLLDYAEENANELDCLKVIDAGCGSGILALSAAALGFGKIYGFDNDPEAVSVCHSNSTENAHIEQPDFIVAELENVFSYILECDLVLANIHTDTLIKHSNQLVKVVKRNGTLILSGILINELEKVRREYREKFSIIHPDLNLSSNSRIAGEWADLKFTQSEK